MEESSRVELDCADLEQELDLVLDCADPEQDLDLELDFSHLVEDVAEIPERKPRAGDKAVADLPELAVAKDGKVMELVSQKYIRALLKSPPRTRPLPDCSIEAIRYNTGITDMADLEAVASSMRAVQRGRDIYNDIIRQYLDKGYAYIQVPGHSPMYPVDPAELPPLP